MTQNHYIVFVCEHGAAKSIVAAAHFNRLAGKKYASLRALARGTHPDPEISPKTIAGLRGDGLEPPESIPTQLSWEEVATAQRIICFCELPEEYGQKAIVDKWLDIPPISENYERSRDAIVAHLQELIRTL